MTDPTDEQLAEWCDVDFFTCADDEAWDETIPKWMALAWFTLIAEVRRLRAEVEMLRTEAAGGVHDPHEQLEEFYREQGREIDRLRARSSAHELRVKALEALCASYRLQCPPSKKTWKLLERSKAALEALDG